MKFNFENKGSSGKNILDKPKKVLKSLAMAGAIAFSSLSAEAQAGDQNNPVNKIEQSTDNETQEKMKTVNDTISVAMLNHKTRDAHVFKFTKNEITISVPGVSEKTIVVDTCANGHEDENMYVLYYATNNGAYDVIFSKEKGREGRPLTILLRRDGEVIEQHIGR